MVVSGMVFEVVEQYMNWIRVLMGDEPSAWMSTKAEETLELLTPARTEILIMNPVVSKRNVCKFLGLCARIMPRTLCNSAGVALKGDCGADNQEPHQLSSP